ncbi:hypothetical protein QL285_055838 [Trifolium repens]|nr:hypothetical protein QL285_055838 [Trifolium repens]
MKLSCTGPRICEFMKHPCLAPRLLDNKNRERDFRKSRLLRGKYCCYHHWVMETTHRAIVPYKKKSTEMEIDSSSSSKAAGTVLDLSSSAKKKKKKKKKKKMVADASVLDLVGSADSESHHLVKCSTFTDEAAAVDSVKAAVFKPRKKKKQKLN